MTENRPEMVEIALRVPMETVRALLSAAAEALGGAERLSVPDFRGEADLRETAAENTGFREEVFRRLARASEEPPLRRGEAVRSERRDRKRPAEGETAVTAETWAERQTPPPRSALTAAEEGAVAPAERDGPEESTAEDVHRRRRQRRRWTEKAEIRGREREGTAEPSLPEAVRREERTWEEPAAPPRRGLGTAGQRLSAPGPAFPAAEQMLSAAGGAPAAEYRPAAAGEETELTPKALSDRWERDSRRYDGGFTLY